MRYTLWALSYLYRTDAGHGSGRTEVIYPLGFAWPLRKSEFARMAVDARRACEDGLGVPTRTFALASAQPLREDEA